MSGILDIKFANVVVEILIENCDKVSLKVRNNIFVMYNDDCLLLQIFTTEPVQVLRQVTSSHSLTREASAIPSVSGFSSTTQQQQPPQLQQPVLYARMASAPAETVTAMPTYATIPARGTTHGQILRSSNSQDHLAGPLHVRSSYQVSYPAASQRVAAPHPFPHPACSANALAMDQSSPTNGTRPARPLAVYQPWNSATQQPPFVQGLDVASPPSSGSSSDSGTQAAILRSPSSSPSNAGFYAYGPTRPPQPLTQAPPPPIPPVSAASQAPPTGRRVRALYNCVGENPAELSFEPNAIIVNGELLAIRSGDSHNCLLSVRLSKEPGWLEGTYRGRTGLIPSNYVQFID